MPPPVAFPARHADERTTAAPAPSPRAENHRIAESLREMAALLQTLRAHPERAAAFAAAAETLAGLDTDVRGVFARDGDAGLCALPAIGPGAASAIAEMLHRGRWSSLDRLRGDVDAEALFRSLPGVGPTLARRLHELLGIDTLEALECAANDGSLARLQDVGGRRAASIGASLTRLLDCRGRVHQPLRPARALHPPPVDWWLDVDRAYRAGDAAGALPKVAPRRFNPGGKAWLPVLQTQREGWHFTAMYATTARAYEPGGGRNRVLIYGEDPVHAECQVTVLTPASGPLAGQRVVRGREAECRVLRAGEGQPGQALPEASLPGYGEALRYFEETA